MRSIPFHKFFVLTGSAVLASTLLIPQSKSYTRGVAPKYVSAFCQSNTMTVVWDKTAGKPATLRLGGGGTGYQFKIPGSAGSKGQWTFTQVGLSGNLWVVQLENQWGVNTSSGGTTFDPNIPCST